MENCVSRMGGRTLRLCLIHTNNNFAIRHILQSVAQFPLTAVFLSRCVSIFGVRVSMHTTGHGTYQKYLAGKKTKKFVGEFVLVRWSCAVLVDVGCVLYW